MKVLITGHTGFIGSNMSGFLKGKDGIEVMGFSRSTGQDILNPEHVDNYVKGSDLVYSFAAYAKPAESVKNPMEAINTNVVGCLNFLEACRKYEVPIVYPSSCEIYGDSENVIKETDEIKPTNPYAASKASSDRICHAYHKAYGLDVKIVRLFNPYGPGQQLNKVIPIFYSRAIDNKDLQVFGKGGEDTRDYVYIDDVISGLWMARKLKAGETVNLATGIATTNLDVARMIIEMTDSKSKIVFSEYPKLFGGIHKQVGSYEKAKELIGWGPRTDIRSGIGKTLEWLEKIGGE